MNHTPTPISNKIVALGGGFDQDPTSGLYVPALRMELRAEAIIRHYNAYPELFEQEGAFIAVTGKGQEALGRSALSLDELLPEIEVDYFLGKFRAAGIPFSLHGEFIDPDAASTPFNFTNLIRRGLDPSRFTPDDPLAVPAGYEYFKRILEYTGKLGFLDGSVKRLKTGEKAGPLEPVLLKLTRTALEGVAIGDHEGVEQVAAYVADHIYEYAPPDVVARTS